MMLKKFLAKKVIIHSPPSVQYENYIPRNQKIGVGALDIAVQKWALGASDNFSQKEWNEIQLKKLKKLLVGAAENIPYWRNLFNYAGFEPRGLEQLEELEKIPIVTRGDLKKIPTEQMINHNISPARLVPALTSGSTGEPFGFFQDTRDILRRRVNTFHEFRLAKLSTETPIIVLGLESHDDLSRLGIRFSKADFDNKKERHRAIYPSLSRKPAVLIANGSDLLSFFLLAQKDGVSIRLGGIFYRGESLAPHVKTRIGDFFGCPIFTTYGSRECSLIGVECDKHNLHQAPWMNYLEITDNNGKKVQPGKSGKVVLTFLENFAMPFIRYNIGDHARLDPHPCVCGRSLPVIILEGRETQFIRIPGTQKDISLLAITTSLNEKLSAGIQKYQLQQWGPSTIKFFYVPSAGTSSVQKNDIQSLLDEIFQREMRITVKKVSRIEPLPSGKTPVFITKPQSRILTTQKYELG